MYFFAKATLSVTNHKQNLRVVVGKLIAIADDATDFVYDS